VQRRLNKGECWDMVISDELFEGHQSGLDVIRMVRQRRETPCILISSRPDELKSAQGAELHALLKPVKPAKLRSLMQFLLMDQTINLND
jgi:DNA-binding response OmpR family regulator